MNDSDTTAENAAEQKRYEARLRRWAAGMGLALEKSRARDPMRMDYGRYRIIRKETDYVVAGRFPYGYTLSLDDVADVLGELERCQEEEAFRRTYTPGHKPGAGFDAKSGL